MIRPKNITQNRRRFMHFIISKRPPNQFLTAKLFSYSPDNVIKSSWTWHWLHREA